MHLKLPIQFFALLAMTFMTSFASGQTNWLDTSFNPGTGAAGGFVETVLPQPDGKILICGNFTNFNGSGKQHIARLNSDGSVDTSFVCKPGYWVRHLILQPDGKIIIGGYFNSINDISRKCIARLNANGSLDTTFDPGTGAFGTLGTAINGIPDPFVFQSVLQGDGKILITGNFTNYNGIPINGIARLNTNGTLDTTFQVGSGLSTWGRSIQVLSNNQILVTGWFDNYKNSGHHRMALINPDGSPDSSFNPFFGDRTAVYDAIKLSDGRYLASGHSLNTNGIFQEEIWRLNANGTRDTSFVGYANEKIQSLCLQADGKILMAGEFSLVDGTPRKSIARLFPDGTLDSSFSAVIDNWAWTVALQADGRILLSGAFATVDGVSRSGVARFLPSSIPRPFNPRRVGNTFSVSVSTFSGKNYALQYKNFLSDTNWISLPSVAGDGTVKTLSDSNATNTQRFYRVSQN